MDVLQYVVKLSRKLENFLVVGPRYTFFPIARPLNFPPDKTLIWRTNSIPLTLPGTIDSKRNTWTRINGRAPLHWITSSSRRKDILVVSANVNAGILPRVSPYGYREVRVGYLDYVVRLEG